jgi:signal transduction histidine kinase
VLADATLIGRAIVNIIENALHAMPGSGVLAVNARAAGRGVQLALTDSGVGMDAEALARVFEPYFSTRTSGTGLGLTIAKRNVESCGGTIEVASERGRGTVVTLWLPGAP